ncbi:FAD binding domain-containing protein [Thermodesulfobacteriota bacterium]
MNDVGYFAPADIGEALKLLADYGGKATVLAGGTDLVPAINYYELKPENIIYIGNLGLDGIKEEKGKLIFGAAATAASIAASDIVAKNAPTLAEAASRSGSVATRTVATIGGNVANASPAADLACALMGLNAEIVLASANGSRSVPIADFFTGPGETVSKPDELLQEIHVPVADGNTAFLKLGRRKALTISVANTAVYLKMDGKNCSEARIALGAMAPTLLRCSKAEEMIKGKSLDMTAIGECAAQAVDESAPIDDQRGTAWYRMRAGQAVVKRALAQAAGISE